MGITEQVSSTEKGSENDYGKKRRPDQRIH